MPFRASLRATAVVPRPMLRLQIDEPPRPATASSTFQHRVGADALLHQTLRRRNRDEQLIAVENVTGLRNIEKIDVSRKVCQTPSEHPNVFQTFLIHTSKRPQVYRKS